MQILPSSTPNLDLLFDKIESDLKSLTKIDSSKKKIEELSGKATKLPDRPLSPALNVLAPPADEKKSRSLLVPSKMRAGACKAISPLSKISFPD